jgi:hypothetical protein
MCSEAEASPDQDEEFPCPVLPEPLPEKGLILDNPSRGPKLSDVPQ